MDKTTVYIPDDLKSADRLLLDRAALSSSGQPIARVADELLCGFGER